MLAAILAAGKAERFGSCKLMAELKGKPVIQHVLEALPQDLEKVIVIGAYQEELAVFAKFFNINTVYNPKHASGMQSSVAFAAQWAQEKQQDLLLTLGDLPMVTREDYQNLMDNFKGVPLFSKFENSSGPPAIFPKNELRALILMPANQHAKKYFQNKATYLEINNAKKDIDTKQDLFKLQNSK